MTRIKFCGMMSEADILAANRLMPDYIGFVFYEKSRRYVSPEQAKALRKLLDPRIRAVGVFVNAPAEEILRCVSLTPLQLIQLHGSEDEKYLETLRKRTETPILQAFRIRGSKDLERAEESTADRILLDAGAGDGKSFNWELLSDFRRPYFLAGGLNPENAGRAVSALHPLGLDVSSGIETNGRKDPERMRAFMESCRKADRKEGLL